MLQFWGKTDGSFILLFHLGICSFVRFKGVWRFLYISNQFIFNKGSETKLSNIFRFCFLRIFCSNLRGRKHVVGLERPVKEPALALNVRCDLICFLFLTWIAVLECWFTCEIPPFLMLNNVEQRVYLAECIQFSFLLIHAYLSLQLGLNFVSLLLISISYILKDMESLVKKLKRTERTNAKILQR